MRTFAFLALLVALLACLLILLALLDVVRLLGTSARRIPSRAHTHVDWRGAYGVASDELVRAAEYLRLGMHTIPVLIADTRARLHGHLLHPCRYGSC